MQQGSASPPAGPRARRAAALALSLGLAACQPTGLQPFGDASVPSQLTYTPAGCDYEVSTPEVSETRRGVDFFDDDDAVDHVHVSFASDSSRTFAVNWRSGIRTLASRILYGPDRATVEAAEAPRGLVQGSNGHQILFRGIGAGTRVHEVHVCGLSPDTTYYYKVGGPGHWSEVFDVTTGPAIGSTAPWSFSATGDSRNNLENSWPLTQQAIFDAGVDLQLFSGDAVFLGLNQADWDLFFEASTGDFDVQDSLARTPFMMANGNHDALAVNFVAQFAFPQEQSPEERAQGEEWYSFDYANAHVVVLNDTVLSNAVLAGAQAEWMRADLAAVDRDVTPWVFVVHHRPFYTCQSNHRPDTSLRAAWQPVFDEHGVDMVFTGHNHVYERSQPIRGLEAGQGIVAGSDTNGRPTYDPQGRPSGTVYVVAAGVGAELYPVSTECPTSFTGQRVRPYVLVEVEDRTLRYSAYNALSGQVIDRFELRKP